MQADCSLLLNNIDDKITSHYGLHGNIHCNSSLTYTGYSTFFSFFFLFISITSILDTIKTNKIHIFIGQPHEPVEEVLQKTTFVKVLSLARTVEQRK